MKCERFFRLIVVGRMKEKALDSLTEHFLTRLKSYGKCDVTVLSDSDVAKEGEAICRELDKDRGAAVFVLSEEGREWSTVELAGKLEALDRRALFIIGGPFGLSEAVKKRATYLWSLSKLTFTHEMARLLLCEQLYRAMNFLNGGGYHHE